VTGGHCVILHTDDLKKYAEHIRKQTVEECRPNKEDFSDERNYNTALNFYRHVLLPRLSALNELE